MTPYYKGSQQQQWKRRPIVLKRSWVTFVISETEVDVLTLFHDRVPPTTDCGSTPCWGIALLLKLINTINTWEKSSPEARNKWDLQDFPASYVNRIFITVFTTGGHWSLSDDSNSYPNVIYFNIMLASSGYVSLNQNLTLIHHLFPCVLQITPTCAPSKFSPGCYSAKRPSQLNV